MWTVIFFVKTKDIAVKMAEILQANKILCKIRPSSPHDNVDSCMEVLVPEAETQRAHEILIDAGF